MTVALQAIPQFFDNAGNPLSGGKIFSYEAGTLIPLSTYTDRSGTTPNANPVILDAAGRADIWLTANVPYKLIVQDAGGTTMDSVDQFYAGADPSQLVAAGIVPATGGTYSGPVSFAGGATFDGTPAQDQATLDSLGIAAAQNVNLFANGGFESFPGGAGSYADGATAFALTQVLCETGSVAVSQVAAPTDGVAYAMRITQPDVGSKRVGLVQRVSTANTLFYRAKQLAFAAKVRSSASATVRLAIVAWTGADDAAPADVVNNWSSTNYTAGNFFIANTLTIAVTATSLSAGSFTDCLASSISAGGVVVPSNTANLYLVIWSDSPLAQNVTLDAANVRCGAGSSAPLFYPSNPSVYGRLLGVRVLTATGTYTRSPGARSGLVIGIGGGGGGGSSSTTGAANVSTGLGGGSGSCFEHYFDVLPASQAYTIGGAGAGGGGNGGTTIFGSLTAPGGLGGTSINAVPPYLITGGTDGGLATGGNILNTQGQQGGPAQALSTGAFVSGAGAPSRFGGGGRSLGSATGGGYGAGSPGAGGGGAINGTSSPGQPGGAGGPGLILVYEYS